MKLAALLSIAAAAAAQPAARPMLSLSANSRAEVELPKGWPLLVTGFLYHSLRSSKTEAAPLTLAPAGLSWLDAITLNVTAEDGSERAWAFRLVGVPKDAALTLPYRSFTNLEWQMSPDDTSVLAPGIYRLRAVLEIKDSAGWAGKAQSPPVTIRVIDPPAELDEAQRTERATLRARFEGAGEKWAAAMAEVQDLLAVYPRSIKGFALKARVLEQQGQLADAIAAITLALEIFYEKNPAPKEPPAPLLEFRSRLRQRLASR